MCYITKCEWLKNKLNYFVTCKYFWLILQPLQDQPEYLQIKILICFKDIANDCYHKESDKETKRQNILLLIFIKFELPLPPKSSENHW